MVDRKVARCLKCNTFLAGFNVVDYLAGSKVLVELELHCPKCGADNTTKILVAPVLKKTGLPYMRP